MGGVTVNDHEFLRACKREGVTIEGLMEEFGIDRQKVNNTRARLRRDGFEFPELHKFIKKRSVRYAENPYKPPEKPWDIVKRHFGAVRVKRCPSRGFLLDGRPVTIHELMKEAGAL